jgi:hypothetical protein
VIAVGIISGGVALAVGWVAGMWTRKRSDQWCSVDGSKLVCTQCTAAGMHSLASGTRSTFKD